MFENLFKLPSLTNPNEPEALDEADVKKARIQFHRDHVRNGPTSARFGAVLGAGKIRRLKAANLARATKRARREQVRNYLHTQQLGASVRGHLQLAGVLPYVVPRDLDLHQQVVSAAWLVQRFGVEDPEDGTVSFKHDDVLTALGEALKFWGQVSGQPSLQIPAGYVVPIYEIEDGFRYGDTEVTNDGTVAILDEVSTYQEG